MSLLCRRLIASVFLAIAVFFFGGCGITRAGHLMLMTAQTAPPKAQMESLDINTVFIDSSPSAVASFLSRESPDELFEYFKTELPKMGWHQVERNMSVGEGKKTLQFEQWAMKLDVDILLEPQGGNGPSSGSTQVWLNLETEYPWDYYICRPIQCSIFYYLTFRVDDKPTMFFIGMF